MAQENYQFTNALKRLSPDLQKKITLLTKNPLLPVWPEQTRGIPNLFIRSALFGVIERGHRTKVNHQKYLEWTPERFKRWAAKIGPKTAILTELILLKRAHPQQAYRTLLGILRLGKSYGDNRLEAACKRALHINALSYRSIESILKSGLDQKPLSVTNSKKEPLCRRKTSSGCLEQKASTSSTP